MSIATTKRRLQKLEQSLLPPADNCFTLLELCRAIWNHDKKEFQELAKNMGWGFLVTTFEFEDAERRRQAAPTSRPRPR